MAASESKRQGDLLHRCVEIPTRGNDSPELRDHEGTIELGQFLDSPAKIWIGDVRPCWRMPGQRVENERARCGEHGLRFAKREQGSDAATLSTFASDFECEFKSRFKNVRLAPRNPTTQLLERRNIVMNSSELILAPTPARIETCWSC